MVVPLVVKTWHVVDQTHVAFPLAAYTRLQVASHYSAQTVMQPGVAAPALAQTVSL